MLSATKRKNLLNEILDVLKISDSGKEEIRKLFEEILMGKFWLAFVNQLPEGKRDDFLTFVKQPGINSKKLVSWFKKENISLSSQSIQKIEDILKDSVKELVKVLIQDIDQEEKAKLLALIKEEK